MMPGNDGSGDDPCGAWPMMADGHGGADYSLSMDDAFFDVLAFLLKSSGQDVRRQSRVKTMQRKQTRATLNIA